jgi:serine/threonine protein kinase/tetratricopeptide (TPR) repeat protein
MTGIEDQARSTFLAALEHASQQWPALLDEACGDNGPLRKRVEELLYAHRQIGSIHGDGAGAVAKTIDEPITERPGTVIGPYKLMELIGEGGMGLVYVAEQQKPLRRKVALKVIKPGMDTRQVVARFEAERQALAIMDHPNIAKVHDGGATASGRPYFVMELVKGAPITQFCDQSQLSPRQPLELFIHVCHAVQHAHQKGIIHRDLKPSNILVVMHDATPVVKVIDFGVAKALGQELTDKTLYTGFAQMLGTPLYMSPEQAGQSGLDIDTRSDIYSLGVLLYELITGTTPFTKERFREAGYDEICRIIREEEPPKPSTRISTLGQAESTVSTQRRSEARQLSRLFRGELDWIVMKALEKDRNRRYETADGLARDLERYLHDEPVTACPPSALYRLRKFARRNQAALTTAALVGAALLTAVLAVAIVSTRAAWRLSEEQAATRKQLGLTEQAEKLAEERAGDVQRTLERLNTAGRLIQSGRFHSDYREWGQAHRAFCEAVSVHPDSSEAWYERGSFYTRMGLWHEAAADFAQGFRLHEPGSPRRWLGQAMLAVYLDDRNVYEQVRQKMRAYFERPKASLSIHENEIVRACTLAPDSPERAPWLIALAQQAIEREPSAAYNLYALGLARYQAGDFEGAASAFRNSLNSTWVNGILGHMGMALCQHCLGDADAAQRSLAKASSGLDDFSSKALAADVGRLPMLWHDWLECQVRFRDATREIEGAPRSDDARLWVFRARALAALELTDRATEACDRAVALRRRDVGIRIACFGVFEALGLSQRAGQEQAAALGIDPSSIEARLAAFKYYSQRGDWQRAFEACQAAQRDEPADAALRVACGDEYLGRERWSEAVVAYSSAVSLCEERSQAQGVPFAAYLGRGRAHARAGAIREAIVDFDAALERGPDDDNERAGVLFERAAMRREVKDTAGAAADLDLALTLEPRAPANRWFQRGEVNYELDRWELALADFTRVIEANPGDWNAWGWRGTTHARRGSFEEAVNDYSRAIELCPNFAGYWYCRGLKQWDLGRRAEAVKDITRAIELDPANADYCHDRGDAYQALGQWAEAQADHRRSVEIDPTRADTWCSLGVAQQSLGLWDEAIVSYVRAVEIDRGFTLATNALAWALVARFEPHPGDFSRAVALAQWTVELEPQDPNCWNTLGVAHYRRGDWIAAIDALTWAADLGGGASAFDSLFFAMSHAQRGQLEQARAYFARAVRLMEDLSTPNDELCRFRVEAEKVLAAAGAK